MRKAEKCHHTAGGYKVRKEGRKEEMRKFPGPRAGARSVVGAGA